MNWLQRLICPVIDDKQFRPPKSSGEIGYSDLYKLLRDLFPEAHIFLSDRKYKLCYVADIADFLKQDQTNRDEYEAEYHDCDDFAYRLMGQFSIPGWSALAFGFCWTDTHAVNCFVNTKEEFMFIEPQKDTIQTKLTSWQGSKVILVCM